MAHFPAAIGATSLTWECDGQPVESKGVASTVFAQSDLAVSVMQFIADMPKCPVINYEPVRRLEDLMRAGTPLARVTLTDEELEQIILTLATTSASSRSQSECIRIMNHLNAIKMTGNGLAL